MRIKRKTKAKKVKNEVKLRVPPLSNTKKSFGEILLKPNSCEVAFDFIFISLGQVISSQVPKDLFSFKFWSNFSWLTGG